MPEKDAKILFCGQSACLQFAYYSCTVRGTLKFLSCSYHYEILWWSWVDFCGYFREFSCRFVYAGSERSLVFLRNERRRVIGLCRINYVSTLIFKF